MPAQAAVASNFRMGKHTRLRRDRFLTFFSAKRIETVALFAQAVYLLFSAVYICKETLEHALLSAGDAGHHHHHAPGQSFELDSGYVALTQRVLL